MEILNRDDLPKGGFAGVREHQLVVDPKVFGPRAAQSKAWSGIGNFVYLADARFVPNGETGRHPHKEIDVISVLVDGHIAHEGSLEHGQSLSANDVQAQRAGGEGFTHNEINPDDDWNRMIQLWVLPEEAGQLAQYKIYKPKQGEVVRVYGGTAEQDETFAANTRIDVALLNPGQSFSMEGNFLAYITRGEGTANGEGVKDGNLFRGQDLEFEATENVQLIVTSTSI